MHDPISDFPPAMSPSHEPPLPQLGLDEFVSDSELAKLIARGAVARAGSVLRSQNGAMYVIVEAVRVLGRAGQQTDPYGFVGVVDSLANMLKRGFVMSAERIALGRTVYDAEFGYLVQPVGNGSADRSGVNPKIG